MADSHLFAVGGADAAPAITLGGRTLTYEQLRRRIAGVGVSAEPVQLAGLDAVSAVAELFAAARDGRTAVIGPSPAADAIPAGTLLLVSTSGSAGTPKLVARTAASWAASFRPLADLAGLASSDVVLLTGRFDSTLHLFAAVHTLWLGAHLTDEPGSATAVHAVPTVLADLLTAPPPCLRLAVVAGDHLPSSVERRARERGVRLFEYYGAAELSFVAARMAPGGLVPFPGVELRIVDGEIWVRSPYVALERIGSSPLRRAADGFVTVGDLGRWGPGGALMVLGRGDSAITTGGHTVLVHEVEDVLLGLPGVREVAVFGLPHQRLGQVAAAAVVLDADVGLEDVRAVARTRLSGPARPRRWIQVDALPRTSGGKLDRAAIAASVR